VTIAIQIYLLLDIEIISFGPSLAPKIDFLSCKHYLGLSFNQQGGKRIQIKNYLLI